MGRNAARIGSLVALAGALASCSAGTPAPPDSGVRGIVLIGPACPVVQEGVPCPDRPFSAAIDVRSAGGEVVATTRSGADGRFRVDLAPGSYVLGPSSGASPPSAAPVVVRVRPHAYARVTITFDSGIR